MARRKGGVPPIVTVLITISAVVAASLVAWFMFTSTKSATQQPTLEVTAAYVAGSAITVTVRNLGPSDISVSSASISCSTGTVSNPPKLNPSSGTIPVGGSFAVTGTANGVSDGASCILTITVTPLGGNPSTVSLGFKVTQP